MKTNSGGGVRHLPGEDEEATGGEGGGGGGGGGGGDSGPQLQEMKDKHKAAIGERSARFMKIEEACAERHELHDHECLETEIVVA
eukprot:SAG22_NODE_5964_length_924_cov_1.362424_2_plen_85_part_00